MRECPCRKCVRKGCGSYHDICIDYQSWVDEKNELIEKLCAERDAKHTNHPTKEQALRKKMRWK